MIFRVFGMKTLSDLFPNLAIIRGERLIKLYALIIYEMLDLHDVNIHDIK